MLLGDMPLDVSLGYNFIYGEGVLNCNSCRVAHGGERARCRYIKAFEKWVAVKRAETQVVVVSEVQTVAAEGGGISTMGVREDG